MLSADVGIPYIDPNTQMIISILAQLLFGWLIFQAGLGKRILIAKV